QAREAQVSNTRSNYIDAVLNADSLADAIGRVKAMTTMVKANNDLMEQQKQDKKALEDKKAENDAKLKEVEANQAGLESQQGDL
ncbi:coiled-coil domain-containing protein, partial [Enterococcus faecium]|uniref:coiled-coil domain-containing protein n=1 Tax=Enterococcus faecium TaxID=1352 RepID=UPI00113478C9